MLKNIYLTVIGLLISAMAVGQVGIRKDTHSADTQKKIKEKPALQVAPQKAPAQKIAVKTPSATKGTVIYFEDFSAGVMPSDYILYDEDGLTPLMHAARFNENPEVIMVILNAGADGKVKSGDGRTAFDYAGDNPTLKDTAAYWALSDARF